VRIFEITDKNQTILKLSGIDIQTIYDEYDNLVNLLNLLIYLKSPHRNQKSLLNIDYFEKLIDNITQNKLLDRSDPDIIELLEKLNIMQRHTAELKSQMTP
jgi:hypothetical protein